MLRKSPYCIQLRATDTTTTSVQSNSPLSATATICLYANLSQIHESDRPAAQALQSANQIENNSSSRRKNRKNRKYVYSSEEVSTSDESSQSGDTIAKIYYPHKVTVSRSATPLTRIIQPVNMNDLIKEKPDDAPVFRIDEDGTKAFAITESGGIIFVRNVTALQTARESMYYLSVKWLKSTASIKLLLVNATTTTNCIQKNGAAQHMPVSCSEAETRTQCLRSCGLGTNGTACDWRPNNDTGFTTNYSTCSPSLSTCPDGICDPLEAYGQKLEHFLCPQDCVSAGKIYGLHHRQDGGFGIRMAIGLCTCDDTGKCSCAHPPEEKTVRKPKETNGKIAKGTTTTDMEQEGHGGSGAADEPVTVFPPSIYSLGNVQCGTSCMALAVLCPIIVAIVVVSVLLSRRKYGGKKLDKRVADDHGGNNNEDIALTEVPQRSATTVMSSEFTFRSSGDPKWEFPLAQLELDTVLGEGEFGRVVKGYARDIGGKLGLTTVAVKMLKNGANSVELMALLSEFQLLQEVRHPNVIKLLGACTQHDAPLIIIEYALHGSLRNYLRLSRKLECNDIEFTNGVEPVTVKEILSFAWQICKGMAYLTEIKVSYY